MIKTCRGEKNRAIFTLVKNKELQQTKDRTKESSRGGVENDRRINMGRRPNQRKIRQIHQ